MTNFKTHERKTASMLGGKRNIDGKGGAAVDVTHDCFAIECKTRRDVPQWLQHAMQQARGAATAGQLPIVVIHPHGARYADDLVVLRLADFRDWFGELPGI